jgi:hypothetical protein
MTVSLTQIISARSPIGYTGSLGPVGYTGSRGAGYTGSVGYTGSIGNIAVANVLYVSKSGDDANDGTALNYSKLTIRSALATATSGTTIFVKSGDYTEINPMTVPRNVSIVGDNLKSVTVRPANPSQDIFYVNNGSFITQMTFKDHVSPAAAVAFNPDGSAGIIYSSPYVQDCTSMTTTGIGMRIDGSVTSGLRSMVADSFTQFNQGGIGVYLLNRGYAQLVSVFTICCDKGFYATTGGRCSISNSNSSFGNYALYADGVSSVVYRGYVVGATSGSTFVIDGLTTQPNVGDAVLFDGDTTYYTVLSSSALSSGNTAIVSATNSYQDGGLLTSRAIILAAIGKIGADATNYLNRTYPNYQFNQFTWTKNLNSFISAIVDDMIFYSNYRSTYAAIQYWYSDSNANIVAQKSYMLASLIYARADTLSLLTVGTNAYNLVGTYFDNVYTIVNLGVSSAPSPLTYTPPVNVDVSLTYAANILAANKNFLIEEGIAYITLNYPSLSYSQSSCRRDIGYIVDSVVYDIQYSGNSQTANAADSYYSAITGALQIDSSELAATIATYNYIGTVASNCVTNISISRLNNTVIQNVSSPASNSTQAARVISLFGIVTNLLQYGYASTVVLDSYYPSVTIADNANARFYQFSTISTSGHTFEWVGTGTNVNTALPALGGVAIAANQAVTTNQGQVFYTSTNERGDFNIGDNLIINRSSGTITGRTFNKSLFAVMTPYILAIGGGDF